MSCAREPDRQSLSEVTAGVIVEVFDQLFAENWRTRLIGGADEPLYRPAVAGRFAEIHFREDFPASALHEVAHWCIAGKRRRGLVDYGYWYAPDGRSAAEQALFVTVEARPQALEWHFAHACGLPFRLSLDNLDAPPTRAEQAVFARAVAAAAMDYASRGLPPRAALFAAALRERFGVGACAGPGQFAAGEGP
jgi:elongation factor P hydroxylase